MKRWTHIFLIVCMVLLLPAVSIAARAADTSGACGDNLTWTFDEATGTLTIQGTGPMWDWDGSFGDILLLLPPWHNHRSSIKSVVVPAGVTSIGDYAFHDCTSLTEIAIPDGVTSIGISAFYNCRHLTEVTIPDGVTSIGYGAFYQCTNLNKMAIPAGVTSIVGSTFGSCEGLTEVLIPASVTYIGAHAFECCFNLTFIDIPNNVTTIDAEAFFGCVSLTEVAIPASVTFIGDQAFRQCHNLTTITVDEDNTQYCSIDGVLFSKDQTALIQYPAKRNAESYTIPDSVTSIGGAAFERCAGLTQVSIPDSLTSIAEGTFDSCYSLTQVTIPNSVTFIGDYAFFGCSNLTDVYYKGKKEQWNAITVKSGNDPLLNATIHFAFDPETGAVFIPPLPNGAESALIAAYGDGKLLCTVTGQVGNDNYIALANQPDEIRIFYLGGNYQPVTAPDIIPLG